MTYKKKLIEVALPLAEINDDSPARTPEKGIRLTRGSDLMAVLGGLRKAGGPGWVAGEEGEEGLLGARRADQ